MPWGSASTIALQLGLALISGTVIGWVEMRWGVIEIVQGLVRRRATYYPQVWQRFFATEEQKIVYVRLTDGTIYYGTAGDYTVDPDQEPKELTLEHTWFFEGEHAEGIEIGRPVYLCSDSIAAIEAGPAQGELCAEGKLADT